MDALIQNSNMIRKHYRGEYTTGGRLSIDGIICQSTVCTHYIHWDWREEELSVCGVDGLEDSGPSMATSMRWIRPVIVSLLLPW